MSHRLPIALLDYALFSKIPKADREKLAQTEYVLTVLDSGGQLQVVVGNKVDSIYDAIISKYDIGKNNSSPATEPDDIFAASCYCPIHNLENADSAYEWLFAGQNDYYRTKHQRTEHGIIRVPDTGHMTPSQIKLSHELKALFPSYLNQLGLTDDKGTKLTLNKQGEGPFKDFVKEQLLRSANQELQTHENETTRQNWLTNGSQVEQQPYLTFTAGKVTALNWDEFVKKITRMKATPAFDALDLSSPENEEFGDETVERRHFTPFSLQHSSVSNSELADEKIIKTLNPVSYICEVTATIAKHWRIRHGSFDRDTSLAIPLILALLLKNKGYDVDFEIP